MKYKNSKSRFGIQCIALIIFILFQLSAFYLMRRFFQSELNLVLSVVFTLIYGTFSLYEHYCMELKEKDTPSKSMDMNTRNRNGRL